MKKEYFVMSRNDYEGTVEHEAYENAKIGETNFSTIYNDLKSSFESLDSNPLTEEEWLISEKEAWDIVGELDDYVNYSCYSLTELCNDIIDITEKLINDKLD